MNTILWVSIKKIKTIKWSVFAKQIFHVMALTISLWGILGSKQPGKIVASSRFPSSVRFNNAPIKASPE
jgi:hypothetical protein